uniref:t-SNARE coiled-coil homology domain-containing protein n=1 Tax=Heterorhabditis bacteriophora TaxID=37862 RepID=A0A1I7X8F9_HETBA
MRVEATTEGNKGADRVVAIAFTLNVCDAIMNRLFEIQEILDEMISTNDNNLMQINDIIEHLELFFGAIGQFIGEVFSETPDDKNPVSTQSTTFVTSFYIPFALFLTAAALPYVYASSKFSQQ